jgi:hypothetical protein
VLSGARRNLNAKQAEKLEEVITDFQHIFTTDSEDSG